MKTYVGNYNFVVYIRFCLYFIYEYKGNRELHVSI